MEKGLGKEQRDLLLDELARLQELARLVEVELILHFSSESCHLLLQEMLTAIDKSISLVKSSHPEVAGECLRSAGKIPKKRKIMPKWTKEVRVDSGAVEGVESPVGDGCSWRKYGQKDILGAKHPRCYFRCRHRATQGCPATKQVQRSDGDPLLFRVIYHGEHTCHQAAEQQRSRDLLSSFRTGLTVETEDLVPTTPDNSNCGVSRPSPTLPSPTAGDAGVNSDVNWPSWDTDWMLQELDYFEADLSSLF
ncbi:transcription factor WRKY19-like [Zingiber officinale]|uniref:transcription factor WRKY19-like n=1 Tax=Zingiber officinale TaxID=94328 RepID=UPI001C4B2968|nr:transcription factor WRKY19-like [Zingiber officinale]